MEINGQDANLESTCRSLSSSTATITRDFGLRPIHVSHDPDPRPAACETRIQTFNGFSSSEINETSKHVSNEKDFKQLYTVLADKVGYEHGFVQAISQTLTRVRAGPERRCAWFMFYGHDSVSKRKINSALAEVVFGRPGKLDFCRFKLRKSNTSIVFDFSDAPYRGKNDM